MNDINDIDELTKLVEAEEPEPPTDTNNLRNSTIAYHAVVIVLDLISGAIIGYMSVWFYGVIWFLAGAIAFFQHHKNWENPNTNDYQLKNSTRGMVVSVVAVIAMGLLSGAVLILTSNNIITFSSGYIGFAIEIVTVSLFVWNGYQFAMYKFKDDSFIIARDIARAKGNANKKIKLVEAAGTVVKANKAFLNERNNQHGKHGQKPVDAAFNKMQGFKPSQSFAKDTEQLELKDDRPNSSGGTS